MARWCFGVLPFFPDQDPWNRSCVKLKRRNFYVCEESETLGCLGTIYKKSILLTFTWWRKFVRQVAPQLVSVCSVLRELLLKVEARVRFGSEIETQYFKRKKQKYLKCLPKSLYVEIFGFWTTWNIPNVQWINVCTEKKIGCCYYWKSEINWIVNHFPGYIRNIWFIDSTMSSCHFGQSQVLREEKIIIKAHQL